MYTVTMIEGLNRGWLEPQTFMPVVLKAWQGLAKVIHDNGRVDHICGGFGIHATPAEYEAVSQSYKQGQSGLGSVLRAAVLLAKSNFTLYDSPLSVGKDSTTLV